MKIKIFNENGITRVEKTYDNNFKADMFHIQDGEVAVIEIESNICMKGKKRKVQPSKSRKDIYDSKNFKQKR